MLRTTKPDKEIFLERKDIKDILFRFQVIATIYLYQVWFGL